MKKIIAIVMLAVLCLGCFASCGTQPAGGSSDTSSAAYSDLAYVQEKGTLVVGMTVYKPMNYMDENDAWTGFDTEYAQAVAEKLGVEAQFVIIDWDNKWATLSSKKIDVVWNGMTLSDEAKANASCTNPYVMNAQVVVMKADKLANYTTAESMKDVKFAVEAGSTGKDIAAENNYSYKEYPTMSDAMSAVKSGKQEACIIDITMANAMTGEGTSFADLGVGISLQEEVYAIACRKGSDLTAKINDITAELTTAGKMDELAQKYEVTLAK